jgi:ABC-type polysaccharide/polyol phosphate transport system ATPase subunit
MNKEIFLELINITVDLDKINLSNRFFSKKKAGKKLLDNISIRVDHSQRLGIIGANGAGKSTLLKVCAEIVQPTSGLINKSGKTLGLFGNVLYDENLYGLEYIKNTLLIFGISKSEIENSLNKIIDFIDIGTHIYQPFSTYSEGMKLRVFLGTLLHSKPNILLIDEGINVGDRFFIQKTQNIIDNILQKIPIILIASHDETLLKKFCEDSILIEKGKIILHDKTEKVLEFYRNN